MRIDIFREHCKVRDKWHGSARSKKIKFISMPLLAYNLKQSNVNNMPIKRLSEAESMKNLQSWSFLRKYSSGANDTCTRKGHNIPTGHQGYAFVVILVANLCGDNGVLYAKGILSPWWRREGGDLPRCSRAGGFISVSWCYSNANIHLSNSN